MRNDDRDAELERRIERDEHREPSAFRARRLPPRGYLRNGRLADIAAGLYDGVEEDAGVLQPPVRLAELAGHPPGASEAVVRTVEYGIDGIRVVDLGPVGHTTAEEWEILTTRVGLLRVDEAAVADRIAESKYLASRCYHRAAELRRRS